MVNMSLAPFDVETDPVPEESMEIARTELRELPENREKAIQELRELILQSKDLNYPDDEEFLTIFLRPCHYHPQSAMKMLRRIAEFKKSNGNLLANIQPHEERSGFTDHNIVNVITSRDQNRRRILIVNCGELWDPKKVSSDQLFRLFYIVHLVAQLEKETQIRGIVVIMDFKGLSMKQIRALTPQFSMRLLTFIQEAMPLRMKQIHIINQPFIFKLVWSMFSPFIKEKLKSRMWFHGSDMRKLHEYMDPAYLPENYGGKLPKINYSGREWYAAIEKHEKQILKWNTYGFNNTINHD